jgi:hypothetical protein
MHSAVNVDAYSRVLLVSSKLQNFVSRAHGQSYMFYFECHNLHISVFVAVGMNSTLKFLNI